MSSGGLPPVSGPGYNQAEYRPLPDLTLLPSRRRSDQALSLMSTGTTVGANDTSSSSHMSGASYSTHVAGGRTHENVNAPHGSMTYRSPSTPSTSTASTSVQAGGAYPPGMPAYGPPYEQNVPSSAAMQYPGRYPQVISPQRMPNFRPPFIPGGPPDSGRYAEPAPQEWDYQTWDKGVRDSPPFSESSSDLGGTPGGRTKGHMRNPSQRRPSNRDELEGQVQFLEKPSADVLAAQERELPHLPTNLYVEEQDSILSRVNDRLAQCAFDFVAKYQFPIPLESDKRPVRIPNDREWTEWCFLLKRLATKRRIPARILYNGQIKQFVTVLENSMEMRHAAVHQSRPPKDDRNVLQLISAGIQVTKLLKDSAAMAFLDDLYVHTEKLIQSRKPIVNFST
ncbi:MAG: hypothetical protein M1837_001850 [Sclerophora amabilis]|nr:MAG: hypothetical protein M1837_001850 [Sclerophora amabilis]